jgi:WD40 repeat protein
VILNNTARGKIFNKAAIQYTEPKKPNYVFVTTMDGLLYFVNYSTRQVDKIIQIHEDTIVSLIPSSNNDFYLTASANGVLRLWSTDFECLKSEVNTGN